MQDLEGVDIYNCSYFMVDANSKLKFAKGVFYNREPESFKTIKDVKDVIRYCIWVLEQNDMPSVSKYAAVVFINRVSIRLQKLEKACRKMLKEQQVKSEKSLNKSINDPGKKYV